MRRSVKTEDIGLFAELDLLYNQIRTLEAKQNKTPYKCLGSGNCCKIGLVIPMFECANIAFKLIQKYYLILENSGDEEATSWMNGVIADLKERMHDETWQSGGETEKHCAFFKGGCSIYEFRPMVCRSVGTITTVDDFCPRLRNAAGGIDYYAGTPVEACIRAYQALIDRYEASKDEDGYNLTVYMPLGVLSFLLTDEELQELSDTTDEKFWSAILGWFNYRVEFVKRHGFQKDDIEKFSKETGIPVAFKFDN